MKRLIGTLAVAAVAAAAPAVGHAATDTAAQTRIVTGGKSMPAAEIARLQGSVFYASVEGQRYAVAHGLASQLVANTTSLHCYGAVKWKKGENAVGMDLWGEWNHTSWCGRRGHAIRRGTVHGYVDTWTGPVWESSNEGWRKWKDPLHPKRSRYTEAHAKFGEGAGGYDVNSETVRVRMHIYASGVWR